MFKTVYSPPTEKTTKYMQPWSQDAGYVGTTFFRLANFHSGPGISYADLCREWGRLHRGRRKESYLTMIGHLSLWEFKSSMDLHDVILSEMKHHQFSRLNDFLYVFVMSYLSTALLQAFTQSLSQPVKYMERPWSSGLIIRSLISFEVPKFHGFT